MELLLFSNLEEERSLLFPGCEKGGGYMIQGCWSYWEEALAGHLSYPTVAEADLLTKLGG